MQEDSDSNNYIPLNIEQPSLFVPNKRVFSEYNFVNIISRDNGFKSSKEKKFYFSYKISGIIISFIFFVIFYLLLITVIISKSTIPIILLPIVYILGQIIQGGILPFPIYHSRENFINRMNQILNAGVIITLTKEELSFHFKGKYTLDATGTINIPDTINMITIGEVQYFIQKKYYDEIKKWNLKYSQKLNYEGKHIKNQKVIFNLNSENNMPPYNAITLILSFFLLQWINALIFHFIPVGDIVEIYPAKLITADFNNDYASESNIVVHGETFDIKRYIMNSINEGEYDRVIKEFQDEIDEKRRKEEEKRKEQEEKRKIEKDREENTDVIEHLYDNHYDIKVIREYNDVYLKLEVDYIEYYKNKHFKKKIDLGRYNKNFKRKEEKVGYTHWIITPEGTDIEIQIEKEKDNLTINIGSIFHKSFKVK